MASHPRFELAVVADDPQRARTGRTSATSNSPTPSASPTSATSSAALREFDVQVAIVSPEAERHCDLSIRAARAGKHVVQDKPLATRRRRRRPAGRGGRDGRRAVPDVEPQLHARRAARPRADRRGRDRPSCARSTSTSTSPRTPGRRKGSRQPGYPPLDWHAHQIAAHVDGSDGGLGREPMGELAIEGIYPLGYIRLLTGGGRAPRVRPHDGPLPPALRRQRRRGPGDASRWRWTAGSSARVAIGRIGAASHPSGGEIKLHVLGTTGRW